MELKIKSSIFYLIYFYSSLSFAQIGKIEINQSNSSVEFLCLGNPSALKIKGEKAKVQGQISNADNSLSAKLKVDLNDFATGIEMRDEHMKEKYFESDKPENRYATLEIVNLNIPPVFLMMGQELVSDFKGKLLLHSIQREISGKITFSPYKKGAEVLTVSIFSIKLTDFNISVPSFAGITVAENITVEVRLPLNIIEK